LLFPKIKFILKILEGFPNEGTEYVSKNVNMENNYDSIVIGSGAGGMTTALALAQSGQKVLLCEKHKLPGGWTHSFSKGGFRFNTGVHYIGDIDQRGKLRRIYEGLGVSRDLYFFEMNPDGYDHILIGEDRFDIPKGEENYKARLKEKFPEESRGIDRLFKKIKTLGQLGEAVTKGKWTYLILHLGDVFWLKKTAGDLIDRYIKDERLKAILSAQVGIHGMPPNRLAAAFYTGGMLHYMNGAYHPAGGGKAIGDAFINRYQEAGGVLKLKTSIKKIRIENKRAIGVELESGEIIHSKYVISNADPQLTYMDLVGPEHLSARLLRKIQKVSYSTSCLSLFLAVDMDLKKMGFDSGNYWIYDSPDMDENYALGYTDQYVFNPPKGLFVSITTLKDPGKMRKGYHQLEVFSMAGYDAFKPWEGTEKGKRGKAYETLKEKISDRILGKLESLIPGVKEAIVFSNLATPLTNKHYVNAPYGNLYGIDKSADQIGPGSFAIRSEIKNLFLCGASTTGHGIGGTTQSGMRAAAAVLNCKVSELLKSEGPELQIFQAEDPDSWPAWFKEKLKT
jgi:all-trans-retinol 13,14-reductase